MTSNWGDITCSSKSVVDGIATFCHQRVPWEDSSAPSNQTDFLVFQDPLPSRIPDLDGCKTVSTLRITTVKTKETVTLGQFPPNVGSLSLDPQDVRIAPNVTFPPKLTALQIPSGNNLPTFIKQQSKPQDAPMFMFVSWDASPVHLNTTEYNNAVTWFGNKKAASKCVKNNQTDVIACKDETLDIPVNVSTGGVSQVANAPSAAPAPAPAPEPTNTHESNHTRTSNAGEITATIAGVVVVLVILAFVISRRRRPRPRGSSSSGEGSMYEERLTPNAISATDKEHRHEGRQATNTLGDPSKQHELADGIHCASMNDTDTTTTDPTTTPTEAPCTRPQMPEKMTNALWPDPGLASLRIDHRSVIDIHQLGSGSFGSVWLVQHSSSGQRLASKRLINADAMTQNGSEFHRFIAEIKLNATLHHKNVVQLFGVAWTTTMDIQALFEFAANGDLTSWLRQPSTRHEWSSQKLNIAVDIMDALVYVHSWEPPLVHRDLKSRNVLLMDDMTAKLCDFGVSRFQSANATMTSGVGTLRWLAPEVIKGDTDYTSKADIYAFGVVLAELDTHQLPFADVIGPNGLKLPEVALAHQVGSGALMPTFRPSCPENVLALARACLSFNPADRPTAAEAAAMLRGMCRAGC